MPFKPGAYREIKILKRSSFQVLLVIVLHHSSYMKKSLVILFLAISVNIFAQNAPKEILLLGTFHFNNPGADLVQVKTFDVMSAKSQQELEVITNKIKQYHPDKIFVEWEYNQQTALDSLYDLYTKNQYFDYVQKRYPKSNFYKQNEIFQLAFKAAAKCSHTKVYAIDYPGTDFPFDSVMQSIEKAKQSALKKEIEDKIKEFETIDNADRQKLNLTQLLVKANQDKFRKIDVGLYITLFNRAGAPDDFAGAYLVSEWYRRNLYMYSLVQKITESSDKKVMVLLGASHIAMFKAFIESDKKFKAVELKEILK